MAGRSFSMECKKYMTDISIFKSRTGRPGCNIKEFYDFVTDIRNFERFISADTFSNLKTDRDSLSFQVNILGTVNICITEKNLYNKVVYKGDTQQVKDFSLIMDIMDRSEGKAEIIVTLLAEINPMLKMVAAAPIKRFLETLIDEMEKFKGWKDIKERNRSL